MNSLVVGLGVVHAVLRRVFFVAAVVLLVVFAVDWLVRTRRIGAFSPVARFFRRTVDPLLAPVQRVVLERGGVPSSTPWWALVVVVVGGILILQGLQYVIGMVALLDSASRFGPGGIVRVLLSWLIGLVEIALLIRVIASWFRISEYNRWIRWTVPLTEWLLRPLRRIIPPFGAIDLTPLIAFFVLRLLQGLVL